MNLLEQIEKDMTAAIKSGDTVTSETLKMVKSDLMYEKAKTGEDLSEEKMLEVVTRAAKRRKESMNEFTKGNRKDLADKEAAELEVIQKYLPEQMSEQKIEAIIKKKISEMGDVSKKDFGRVMGTVMKDLKGKADGAVVKDIINKVLT